MGVKQDSKKAIKLYENACASDTQSCYNLALMYQNAQGVAQDLKKAKEYHKIACDRGFAPSCENLKMLEQSKDDLSARAKEYESKCAAGNGKMCGYLATFYSHGMEGAAKNDAKALSLFQKGCELADINSCFQSSLWLGTGQGGVLRDANAAVMYAKKSCDEIEMDKFCEREYGCESEVLVFKQSACNTLGHYYKQGGKGVKVDSNKALYYFKKSCDLGLKASCASYNSLREEVR